MMNDDQIMNESKRESRMNQDKESIVWSGDKTERMKLKSIQRSTTTFSLDCAEPANSLIEQPDIFTEDFQIHKFDFCLCSSVSCIFYRCLSIIFSLKTSTSLLLKTYLILGVSF